MNEQVRELTQKIAEKNLVLSLCFSSKYCDKEKIKEIKSELDRLLFLYYKSLKES